MKWEPEQRKAKEGRGSRQRPPRKHGPETRCPVPLDPWPPQGKTRGKVQLTEMEKGRKKRSKMGVCGRW